MKDEDDLTMEQRVTKMEAREVDRDQKLTAIYTFITQQNSNPIPATPVPHTELPKASRKARPASPPEFNGDRSEGLAFLNSCQTYIRLCSEEFPDEQTKITWAIDRKSVV